MLCRCLRSVVILITLCSFFILTADLCTYLRVWRNFVNWKGYYAHKMTLKCLILGFAWILLPMNTVLVWTFRILVWTCLGPWYERRHYMNVNHRFA
jgi:hypothetical protein